jgi:hypothetical protein
VRSNVRYLLVTSHTSDRTQQRERWHGRCVRRVERSLARKTAETTQWFAHDGRVLSSHAVCPVHRLGPVGGVGGRGCLHVVHAFTQLFNIVTVGDAVNLVLKVGHLV